jgi:perosamine synthetase
MNDSKDPLKSGEASRTPSPVSKQRITPISYVKPFLLGSKDDKNLFFNQINDRFGTETACIPVGRARSGLYLMTKFAVRNGRKKVILSPHTIADVVGMVTLAGGQPVFADFSKNSTSMDLNQVNELVDDQTACVIVTHYHVNQPEMSSMRQICQERGAYFFDDCAISFGGDIEGRPIGLQSDGSIFSFSAFKLMNFFWGGLITTQDEKFRSFLDEELQTWPALRALDYIPTIKACLKYDFLTQPVIFRMFTNVILQRRAKKLGLAETLEHVRKESTYLDQTLTATPHSAAFYEWSRKMPLFDKSRDRRRMIAHIYLKFFRKEMVSAEVTNENIAGSCFTNFPIALPPGKSAGIFHEMVLSGFDVGRSLYPNLHENKMFSDVPGYSKNVGELTRNSIYLPTHFGVSEEYATEIANKLKRLI